MDKQSEEKIIESHVPGLNGPVPVFRLDGFQGFMGVEFRAGQELTSAEHANEENIDNYLAAFAASFIQIIPIFNGDVKKAMNVIHTTRNGRDDRNRMEAMSEILKAVPNITVVQEVLAEFGLSCEPDSYNYRDLWFSKELRYQIDDETCEELALVHVGTDGKFYIGGGDGYHRGHDEDSPMDLDELRQKIREMVAEDARLADPSTKSN